MKQKEVAIIGAGAVGSTIAYALMLKKISCQIKLIDTNTVRCRGEILDLSDSFTNNHTAVNSGVVSDAGNADIIIIAAGKKQNPGQSRSDLFTANKEIISAIIKDMKPIKKDAVIIIVSNPLDQLALIAQQLSGLPHAQVIGSGTFLDTQRLKEQMSKKLTISADSIHAYVLGEHGDSQFVAWSSATIGGKPLVDFGLNKNELEIIAKNSRNKAYEIIACKGSTYFGIASCVATLCKIILDDHRSIVPVSCFIEKYQLYLSMPTVLGAQGIASIIDLPLSNDEDTLLKKSVEAIRKNS